MKKLTAWLLIMGLLLGCLGMASAETKIEPDMDYTVTEDRWTTVLNPVQEGISPLTGLPCTEAYTPIALVIDNSPETYPHWGIAEASWIFQAPLNREGGTRLLALYGDEYPEQAGGARSGRMTLLPLAAAFNAAFAYVGNPPTDEPAISVGKWLTEWNYRKPTRHYDLEGIHYKERVDFVQSPQNLSAHVKEIHEDLVKREVPFEVRAYLFAENPLDRGEDATEIELVFRDLDEGTTQNYNSNCRFDYREGIGYTRTSKAGQLAERNTGDPVTFANVIVLRAPVLIDHGYVCYEKQLMGSGQADIFQNGKYIKGAWIRSARMGRLVFLDDQGEELKLQPGKTFVVVGNDRVEVSYQ